MRDDRLAAIRARLTYITEENGGIEGWQDDWLEQARPGCMTDRFVAYAPYDIAWLLDEISMLEMDVAEISRKAEDAEDFWKQRAEHLEKYAVHKHNDCWQSGECECGLNNE